MQKGNTKILSRIKIDSEVVRHSSPMLSLYGEIFPDLRGLCLNAEAENTLMRFLMLFRSSGFQLNLSVFTGDFVVTSLWALRFHRWPVSGSLDVA